MKKIKGKEDPMGEWNTYEITLDGSDMTVLINGKKVNEAKECEILAGPISLQPESGESHFRKATLTPRD